MPLKYSFLFILSLVIATNYTYAQRYDSLTDRRYLDSITARFDKYMEMGKFDSAVITRLSVVDNPHTSTRSKMSSCLTVANAYLRAGGIVMMDFYLAKAKGIADTAHSKMLDSIYINRYSFVKANQYYEQNNNDSAIYYVRKSLQYDNWERSRNTTNTSILYEILANSLYKKNPNNLSLSTAYFDSAFIYLPPKHAKEHAINILLNKAEILKVQHKYALALHDFLHVYEDTNNRIYPKILLWAAQGTADCYAGTKDYKRAYQYIKEVAKLTEELYSPQQLEGFKKAEIEYRERENKDLATINAQEQSIVKAQQIQLTIAIAALVLLGLGAFLLYRNRQLLNKQKEIAESQSKQLQQLDAINKKIFATISHDLNSPLITLESLFELMGVQEGDQSNSLFYLDVRQQLYSCNQVLQNLLQWGRAELGQQIDTTDKVSAEDTIRETVEQSGYLSKPKKLDINIANLDDSNHLVPTELFKIVSRNLLNNAIKFSPIGSTIDIVCKLENNGTVVSFTNIGQLKEDILNNLFKEVVISTKGTGYETGYGLGLYITAQLMQKIGGRVVAENNSNGTCTFTLYFNNKADAGYSTT